MQPLDRLAGALEAIGDGCYRTRISGRLAPELARLRDSFNRMAARLAEADAENRRLHEELLTLQEQERSELARDLHDEVSVRVCDRCRCRHCVPAPRGISR